LPGLSIFTFTDTTIELKHFKINERFYALVISHLRMPVMDGIQLITRVKEMNHSVRTILMTTFDVDDRLFQEYSKKEIINGFAQKPVSLQILVHEVSDQLHSYEMQKISASYRLNRKNIYKLLE
jgi:DNA-binding NtrC family response regulator